MANPTILIEEDRKLRKCPTMNDLIIYPDGFTGDEDFKHPQLVRSHEFVAADKLRSFVSDFYSRFPMFNDFDWTGILIAGGLVSSIIANKTIKDIDIFFYGPNPEVNFTRIIGMFGGHQNIRFKYNRYNLTFRSIGFDVQLIFKRFDTIADVLYSFDIPSCAIGFDGLKLYTTKLGDFTWRTKVNIIDLTRRSFKYDERLVKYFGRGFGILFPNLKADILKQDGVYIIGGIAITVDGSLIKPTVAPRYETIVTDLRGYHASVGETDGKINAKNILLDRLDELNYVSNDYTRKDLTQTRDFIQLYHNDMTGIYQNYQLHRSLDLSFIVSMHPNIDINVVVEAIVMGRESVYMDLVNKTVEKLTRVVEELDGQPFVINWNNTSDGIFEPIPIDPKEWYCDYYEP